jgi:hypothetical protein
VNRKLFVGAVVLGAVIRAAALPLPGTRDVGVWKIWTYNAAFDSPARLYGVGGSPPDRRVLGFHGAEATVDYPPLALFELAAAGRAYRLVSPAFRDTAALTSAIKILLALFEVGFLLLVFGAVQAHAGTNAARWATAAYWLNPAPIIGASILGYLDPLFVWPLAGSLLAGCSGWPLLAGILFAIAIATKAQAVVVLPAVALALWNGGGGRDRLRRFALAGTGGAAAVGIILAPFVAAGSLPNLLQALQSLTRHDMLSGNACNLWWIVGYVLRAWYSMADMGVWPALTAPARILAISRTMEIGYPNPRLIGAAMTLGAMAWALWTAARARDPFLIAAVAAFMVHAYATLSAQVHENHLFAAVPLLVLAAAGRPQLRPVMWTVSGIFALNLNLFYGVSEYIDGWAVPRAITVIDLTVLLALVNCATLVWHAAVIRSECSTATVPHPSPIPASTRAPAARPG